MEEVGCVVRRNCVNVGEWMLGVEVRGIKTSINWRGVRGISFDWVGEWERSVMEMNCVFP